MRKILLAAMAAAVVGTSVGAAFGADLGAFVAARKGYMLMLSMNVQTLGAMAKGTVPYDQAMAKTAAGNIAALASVDTSFFWLAGTDSKSMKQSNALPEAISDTAGRAQKLGNLRAAADQMQSAAGTDLPALTAAMGPLGGACGDCHKAYRQAN